MPQLSRALGYTDPAPIEPEDERAALQRRFIEAASEMGKMMQRMELLAGRAP